MSVEPGLDDGLDRLWTPHRMAYINGATISADTTPGACPFDLRPDGAGNDLVVAWGEQVFAVLNLYPYNPGHLMVVPYRHVADYTDLSRDETLELADFTQRAMRTIRDVSAAHGFNIGMNQGSVAGAGIAAHLHQHVVPRWAGDQNFMPIIGRTRTLPELMSQTRDLLAAAWT